MYEALLQNEIVPEIRPNFAINIVSATWYFTAFLIAMCMFPGIQLFLRDRSNVEEEFLDLQIYLP